MLLVRSDHSTACVVAPTSLYIPSAQRTGVSHSRQIHRGGPCSRRKYPSSRAIVYTRCKTNALNARPVINHHLTTASRVTSAVVCVCACQELVFSHIDVPTPLRDPEIHRVDGSVQQQQHSIIETNKTTRAFKLEISVIEYTELDL